MRRIMILVLGVILGIGCGIQDAGYREETLIEIIKAPGEPRHPYQTEYEQMLYPTVRITAGYSTGTGVIISTTDRHRWTQIITAAHVVRDENTVNIELYNAETITGTVVITDTDKDLALIHTPYPLLLEGNKKSPLERGGEAGVCYFAHLAPESYQAYLFTPVWAVGCSLGLKPRPSQGIISQIPPSPFVKGGDEGDFPYWEISAPILPGNSGGPVYDARTYEIIGIAVWVKVYNGQLITTMAGVVPINEIYNFLTSYEDTKK